MREESREGRGGSKDCFQSFLGHHRGQIELWQCQATKDHGLWDKSGFQLDSLITQLGRLRQATELLKILGASAIKQDSKTANLFHPVVMIPP